MGWFWRKSAAQESSREWTRPEVVERLGTFVSGATAAAEREDIGGDTPLFSGGYLDSLSLVNLVLFVEKTFERNLSDFIDVTPDNLDTLDSIADAVLRSLDGASEAGA